MFGKGKTRQSQKDETRKKNVECEIEKSCEKHNKRIANLNIYISHHITGSSDLCGMSLPY